MIRTDAPHDGSWEQPGRNPLAAAIVGLVLCGAVYSALGGVASGAIAVADLLRDPTWVAGERLVDLLVAYYRRFQVPILVVTTIAQFAVFFTLAAWLVRRWHSSRPARYLGYRRPRAVDVLLAAAGAVAVVPIAEVIDRWSYFVLPPLRELAAGGAALVTVDSPWRAVLVFVAVAVTPAICEETLFRGWLLGTMRRRLSPVPAIALQAVLFALFHMSPLSIVALAVVGVYLGFLFERTGTIYASMTAHGLYNATVIAVTNLEPRWLLDATGGFSLPVIGASLAALAAVLAALVLRGRRASVPAP
jgi:membrane protease YdiL (CAAX protease family)